MFPLTYDKGTILTIYMSHWHRAIYFIELLHTVNFQGRGVLLILDNNMARAYCACSRWGWGCFDILTLLSFSLSLRDGPIID